VHAHYAYANDIRSYLAEIESVADGSGESVMVWFTRLASGQFWDLKNPVAVKMRERTEWDFFASPFRRIEATGLSKRHV